MTVESLKRANDITKKIEIVKGNLEKIEKIINRNGEWDKNTVIVLSDGDRDVKLYDDILPINTKDIVTLYKLKAAEYIARLQKELESL